MCWGRYYIGSQEGRLQNWRWGNSQAQTCSARIWCVCYDNICQVERLKLSAVHLFAVVMFPSIRNRRWYLSSHALHIFVASKVLSIDTHDGGWENYLFHPTPHQVFIKIEFDVKKCWFTLQRTVILPCWKGDRRCPPTAEAIMGLSKPNFLEIWHVLFGRAGESHVSMLYAHGHWPRKRVDSCYNSECDRAGGVHVDS